MVRKKLKLIFSHLRDNSGEFGVRDMNAAPKMKFSIKDSSVNVTKSAGNYGNCGIVSPPHFVYDFSRKIYVLQLFVNQVLTS